MYVWSCYEQTEVLRRKISTTKKARNPSVKAIETAAATPALKLSSFYPDSSSTNARAYDFSKALVFLVVALHPPVYPVALCLRARAG